MRIAACPFCGARGRTNLCVEEQEYGQFAVQCHNCGTKGPDLQPGVDADGNHFKREAVLAWNTRAASRPLA